MTTEILTSPDVDSDIRVTESVDIDESNETPNLRHIVRPMDNPHISRIIKNPKGQDVVDIARVRKIKIKALCGKEWIPTSEGSGLDTCDTCIAMAGMIKGGE